MRLTIPENFFVAVIDDDDNLRLSFVRLLRAAGMRAVAYVSAEAFLSDAKHPRFDCLVLDLQLPGMSGLDLQAKLQAEGNGAPIIFITAYDDVRSREQAHAMGCAGYFRKSDSGRDVLNAIKKVVTRQPRTP
jgi:FixJ family two-component response regulator